MKITETYRLQTTITDQLPGLTEGMSAYLHVVFQSIDGAPVEIITDKTLLHIRRARHSAETAVNALRNDITKQLGDLVQQHLGAHAAEALEEFKLSEATGDYVIGAIRDRFDDLAENQAITYDQLPEQALTALETLRAQVDNATLDRDTIRMNIQVSAMAEESDQIPTTVATTMNNPYDYYSSFTADDPMTSATATLPTALRLVMGLPRSWYTVTHPWHNDGEVNWTDRTETVKNPQALPFEQLYQLLLTHQSLAMDVYRAALNR